VSEWIRALLWFVAPDRRAAVAPLLASCALMAGALVMAYAAPPMASEVLHVFDETWARETCRISSSAGCRLVVQVMVNDKRVGSLAEASDLEKTSPRADWRFLWRRRAPPRLVLSSTLSAESLREATGRSSEKLWPRMRSMLANARVEPLATSPRGTGSSKGRNL
jgi:hypothetical protein